MTFAIKCLKSENPRINNIFSKEKTIHGMNLRKYEKIEVKFAKAHRLYTTYMQRIINSENVFEKRELKER